MLQPSSSEFHAMLGKPLLAIEEGRIFCRAAGDGNGTGYLGIVAMPRAIQGETLRAFRLNTGLWMDAEHVADAVKRMDSPSITAKTFGEFDANSLFNSMKFAQGLMPDAIELFVRRTFIEHNDPSMTWSLVMGASAKRLPALEKDGLYEIKAGAIAHIDANIYKGMNLGQIFREPVWGPEGKYGIGTTMEPGFYQVLRGKLRGSARRCRAPMNEEIGRISSHRLGT